jgi:hypothetical protein
MTLRSDSLATVLNTAPYADQHRVIVVERMLRACARWLQGNLRNVHVDYRESFSDESLSITLTVKVSELLAMREAGKPKASIDNRVSR